MSREQEVEKENSDLRLKIADLQARSACIVYHIMGLAASVCADTGCYVRVRPACSVCVMWFVYCLTAEEA